MKSSNKKRSKLKPNELEKKIQFQDHSKWEYILPREKTIEFKRPVQTSINHRLSLILPLSNVDNKGQYLSGGPILDLLLFYIPENKYKDLTSILNAFTIPEDLHSDLIWTFINMALASSISITETQFYEQVHKDFKEWIEFFGILDKISNEELLLKSLVIEYQEPAEAETEVSIPKTKTRRTSVHHVLEYLTKALQYFKTSDTYDLSKLGYDHMTEIGIGRNAIYGYKNMTKKWQSYYSLVLYDFLTQNSIESKYGFVNGRLNESNNLPKQHNEGLSDRKIFLLIGKLMNLSGLLSVKDRIIDENATDETIIDTIEKKILSEIKEKKKNKTYKNSFLNQGIKYFQIPPFYYHFT